MSTHFVAGKPGGGKTLFSVRLILNELITGHRTIVTNVALKLDMVNEYLQNRYTDAYLSLKHEVIRNAVADINVTALTGTENEQLIASVRHITDRIILIDEDQMRDFFCYRGNGVKLVSVSNAEWKAGKRIDFSPVNDNGVFYVLDEVQNVFNARAWASTGAQVLYYLSQHRKLGDDVVCITQAVNNVDKQFRSVAQDFTYIKNLGKTRHGVFKLPSVFIRQTYAQPATGNVTAMETGTFRLDVTGLASLYDTAKGVGIIGRSGADTKEKKRGIHWMFAAVGFPLVIWLGLVWFPKAFTAYTSRGVRQATVKLQQKISGAVQPEQAVKAPVVVPGVVPVASQVVTQYVLAVSAPVAVQAVVPVQSDYPSNLFCVGYYSMGGNQYTVILSDGSTVSTQSGRLRAIAKEFIILDGRRLRVRAVPATGPEKPALAAPVIEPYGNPVYIPVPVTVEGAK